LKEKSREGRGSWGEGGITSKNVNKASEKQGISARSSRKKSWEKRNPVRGLKNGPKSCPRERKSLKE